MNYYTWQRLKGRLSDAVELLLMLGFIAFWLGVFALPWLVIIVTIKLLLGG